MERFIPKDIPDDDWEKLTPHKSYAVLCGENEQVYVKIGSGKSFYLGIWALKGGGRLLNSLQFDTGDESLLFKLSHGVTASLGRSLESTIKIMHSIISRKHLEFRLFNNVLLVKDYSSTNGSYLHKNNVYFSVDDYLEHNPIDETGSKTLDEVHQAFGPLLDDFFRDYLSHKEFDAKEEEIRAKIDQKKEE